MTAPIKTNKIMALHMPTSYQHAKGDMDDDVEFATDMEDRGVATIKATEATAS